MSGVTPYITLAQIAGRMKDMNTFEAVNEALDEVEYLSLIHISEPTRH